MGLGAPGAEQFEDAVVKMRNLHIAAGLAPLFILRNEVIANDEFSSLGGTDSPTQSHLVTLLVNADRWRRRVTHNPDKLPLGDKIEKAIDAEAVIEIGDKPFGGDDIQGGTGRETALPFALDGSDPDIPVNSQINLRNPAARIFLAALDATIVAWTRLRSKDRTRFITASESMDIYGKYQELLGYLASFCGDKNQVHVAQLLPSEEPRGPLASPNRIAAPPVGK